MTAPTLERVRVQVYVFGISRMVVCAEPDATDAEILEVCNRENPSGTVYGWTDVVREGVFTPMPCECNPARLHFVVSC